jgi:signal transduction histidine kinase
MKSQSVRSSLALLTIGWVLPVLALFVFVMVTGYHREQEDVAIETLGRARAVTSAVDREFNSVQMALFGLATSPQLAKGDLVAFHAQAKDALKNLDVENIVLLDTTGQMLLTTRLPIGTPLPRVKEPVLLKRMMKTGKPGVSDLFLNPIDGEPIYTIAVPIIHDGTIVYSLNAILLPVKLAAILTEQKFPESWRATIIDGSASVVARTHELKQFLGKKVVPDLSKRMSESSEQSFETKSLEGIPVLTAYSRSAVTGWTVAIGAPLDEINAGNQEIFALMIAISLIALGLGMAVAWIMGGRIAQAFTDLIKPAKALGAGEAIIVQHLPIKEANEVGAALLDASNLLTQANQTKADFLSSMSHELRTPLNAILGFAQLIEGGSPSPTATQKKSLDQILKAGWHLLEMVNEVLNLALVKSDLVAPHFEKINLEVAMHECQAIVGPHAIKSGIHITFPRFEAPILVWADRFWLDQSLLNILSNAIKYNQPDGSVFVEVTNGKMGSIRISVRDTGSGLSQKQIGQIFQPFSRLSSQFGMMRGMGVSLVVTKQLVDRMGGAVGVESIPGKGSLFWIELNLMPVE